MSELGSLHRYVDYWEETLSEPSNRQPAVRCDEHPVIKRTDKGCWIKVGTKRKFVLNDAGKKFAYHRKKDALNSFIRRKNAQIRIVSDQLEKAQGASVIAQRMANGGKPIRKKDYKTIMQPVRVPVAPPLQAHRDRDAAAGRRQMEAYTEAMDHSAQMDCLTEMQREGNHRRRSEHEARQRQTEEAARPVLQEGAIGRLSASLRGLRERRDEAQSGTPSPF